ncbi:MAG: MIP family channel protein [Prevotellaceae bacterium]|jgi:aquaporin Z|nr:MIP family channel protein [Prevotellaceae bacterium]
MKKYIAEMVGTMVLVLMGCGSAVIAGGFIGYMGISFAFGLSVLAMVYAIGGISGCHINPAITFGMWIAKKIESKDAIMYMIFQIIGAIIGSGILFLITQNCGAMGANAVSEPYSVTSGIIAEIVFTFIFVIVVFGAISSKAPAGFAGIAIGLALVLIHLVCIPITGTSVNPARSIAPAIFQGGKALSQLWIFILAPMIGGGLAALCWKGVFEEKKA